MARGVNIDPNLAQEQSRYFHMKALAMAKNIGATTGKKALFIIIPVFLVAAFLGLAALGVFSKGSYVRYNGMIYKVTENYTSRLSEEYALVGTLEQTEDPRKVQEDMVTNWRSGIQSHQLYINTQDDRWGYVGENSSFYQIRRKGK